jgi:hypothetical protein
VQYDTKRQLAKIHEDRYDVVEADREDEEAGGFDRARQRYQQMFWEQCLMALPFDLRVDELNIHYNPVMPGILDVVSESAASTSESKTKVNIVERPGRPAIKFVDVGNMFLDVRDQERRAKEGERRAKVRARRRECERMTN